MAQYPLIFAFSDKVTGNGYLADVTVHGSVLATHEEGGWWMYGVNPGALAASGTTMTEAYVEFRKSFFRVLVDIATEAESFYDFRKAAKAFFDELNEPTYEEWEAARELVRAGQLDLKGIRHDPSPGPRRIEVKERPTVTLTPQDNVLDHSVEVDQEVQMAAAA
jgi:hypothetical protein